MAWGTRLGLEVRAHRSSNGLGDKTRVGGACTQELQWPEGQD